MDCGGCGVVIGGLGGGQDKVVCVCVVGVVGVLLWKKRGNK